jgi:hypothetical protein
MRHRDAQHRAAWLHAAEMQRRRETHEVRQSL